MRVEPGAGPLQARTLTKVVGVPVLAIEYVQDRLFGFLCRNRGNGE
jgi:hypothetical protein